MIIVFFEYEAKPFFFGVTAGKQTTRCSLSRDDVANELAALQKDEGGRSDRGPAGAYSRRRAAQRGIRRGTLGGG